VLRNNGYDAQLTPGVRFEPAPYMQLVDQTTVFTLLKSTK